MKKIIVTPTSTPTAKLSRFMESVSDKQQVRGKPVEDGKIELYTKDRNQGFGFGFGFGSAKVRRQERFDLARETIHGVQQRSAANVPLNAPSTGQKAGPLTGEQVREAMTLRAAAMTKHFDTMEDMLEQVSYSEARMPSETWIHGSSAVGEILLSREVWGGHAGLKLAGREAAQDHLDLAQSHHFFVAQTGEEGVSAKPGNASSKACQDAGDRLRTATPHRSWEHAGRTLLGVLEFASTLSRDLGDAFSEAGEDIGKVRTRLNGEGNHVLALTGAMLPTAVRLVTLGDAVRLIDFLRANLRPGTDLAGYLPTEIRIRGLSSWDGVDSHKLIHHQGEFSQLVTHPTGWHTYQTADLLAALDLI